MLYSLPQPTHPASLPSHSLSPDPDQAPPHFLSAARLPPQPRRLLPSVAPSFHPPPAPAVRPHHLPPPILTGSTRFRSRFASVSLAGEREREAPPPNHHGVAAGLLAGVPVLPCAALRRAGRTAARAWPRVCGERLARRRARSSPSTSSPTSGRSDPPTSSPPTNGRSSASPTTRGSPPTAASSPYSSTTSASTTPSSTTRPSPSPGSRSVSQTRRSSSELCRDEESSVVVDHLHPRLQISNLSLKSSQSHDACRWLKALYSLYSIPCSPPSKAFNMFVVEDKGGAIALMCAALFFLGTWPALLTLLERRGRLPQHTYLDYSITNLLAAVLIALTLGQIGESKQNMPNFFTQLSQDNWPSVLFAMAGGVVLSVGNLCTQYAWAYVGLSVTEVICASMVVAIGTTVNYFLDNRINRADILFTGVACFLVAVILGTGVHSSNAADNKEKLSESTNRRSMSMKKETVDKVCEIVKSQIALDDATESGSSKFTDLGADSLDTMLAFVHVSSRAPVRRSEEA